MIPEDVMQRTDVSAGAKLVLAVQNMESFGSGFVSMSHAVVANKAGISRPQVLACLASLCGAGLIEKDGPPVKQVQPYRLLHPTMHAKVGAPQPDTEPRIDRKPVTPVSVTCLQCHRICKRLPVGRICRTCAATRKMERTARRVVREELASVRTA